MVKVPAKVKNQIRAYIEATRREWNVSMAILFGSYAKGKARKDSDIDLAIVSANFPSPPTFSILKRLQELKWGIAPDIEPIAIDMKSFKKATKLDFVGGVICKEGVTAYKNKRYLI